MMLRARSQFDGTLAMVTLFHRLIANADARICSLPFVPLNIAVMPVAHLFPHSEITSVHATYQRSSVLSKFFTVPLW
jgi:hypothetical protein